LKIDEVLLIAGGIYLLLFYPLAVGLGTFFHIGDSIIIPLILKKAITRYRDGGFYTIVHGLRMVEKNVFAFGERARVAINQARMI
jgi:hypothetical protein